MAKKKNRSARKAAPATEKKKINAQRLSGVFRDASPYLGAVVFFFAVCLGYNFFDDRLRTVALAATIITAALTAVRARTLWRRMTLPVFAMTLYIIVDCASALNSARLTDGTMGLYAFLAALDSYCIAMSFTALAPREKPGRWLATVIAGAAAIVGLLSIDQISTRLLSEPVLRFLSRWVPDYGGGGLEDGVRITSIFASVNIFAGLEGIGVMLSLGLLDCHEAGWRRNVDLVLLAVNALGFLLAFSMGATGMIALGFVVYLLLEGRGGRLRAIPVMLEAFAVTMVSTMVISLTSFSAWSGVNPIPDLCLAAGAAAMCLLDRYVGRRLTKILDGRGKIGAAILGGAVLLTVVYAAAAVSWTGGVTLPSGGALRRAAYPEPGQYTLHVDADGPVNISLESQNRQETMMHTGTPLYSGPADGASFTVPEGSLVAYFDISAPQGAHIESVRYAGAGDGSLPLEYKILPGFMANRLQGLRANENAIQRTVFFADGLKLFAMRPVFGWGLSGFENNFGRTQSFYYTTRYVHNHYIEVLIDKGVIGIAVFLFLLLGSGAAVLMKLRRGADRDPLAPALGAALVYMAGHAAVEVIFSGHQYLPFGYGVFLLIGLTCGDALRFPKGLEKHGGKVRAGAVGVQLTALLVFAVLIGCNIYAVGLVKEGGLENYYQAVESDPFEWTGYAETLVHSAQNSEEGTEARSSGDKYARMLEKKDDYTVSRCLAEYYLRTGRAEKGLEFAKLHVTQVGAVTEGWQAMFDLLRETYDGSELMRDGILEVYAMMETWNARNLGTIALGEETTGFIESLKQAPAE